MSFLVSNHTALVLFITAKTFQRQDMFYSLLSELTFIVILDILLLMLIVKQITCFFLARKTKILCKIQSERSTVAILL